MKYPSGLLRDHPKMRTPLTAEQIREVELRQWDVYWRYWRPASLLSFAAIPTPDLLRKEHFEP